ncbi:hypothetical protein F5Y19DRAFT_81593 [Xylariaceae sp. FL1651]|nr:hypothetical protein F5Y19DRAFT_81593 [Xylariaceae sp. FL1651]
MYNTKVLLSVAALTGASLAQSSDDAACTNSYASLALGLPTPASGLASAITSYANEVIQTASVTDTNPLVAITEVCDFASQLPSSLQSDFSSYVTAVRSYASASSSAIDAVITNCLATGSEGAAYASFINSLATQTGPLCQITSAPSGGNGTVSMTLTPTPTPSNTNSSPGGSAATTSPSTAAAAGPTGVFAGAAAAAGLLGAVALL